MQLRRVGFLALVAVALVGCGTAVSHALGAQSFVEGNTVAPVTDSVACPSSSPGPTTNFCLTPAELAAGQENVHSPTVPDSVLLSFGISLTISPSDSAPISAQEAETTAVQFVSSLGVLPSAPVAASAVLAERHDQTGQPVSGPLVWVIDVTPTGGAPAVACGNLGGCNQLPQGDRYVVTLVNATTGVTIGAFTN
jgi:hypothetical protein